MPLIELEENEQKIPELSFPISVETTSEVFNDAIEDVDVVGDSVNFIVDKGTFTVSSEGDLSNAKIVVKQGDDTKIKTNSDSTIKSKYSIEYLKKMIGASKFRDFSWILLIPPVPGSDSWWTFYTQTHCSEHSPNHQGWIRRSGA